MDDIYHKYHKELYRFPLSKCELRIFKKHNILVNIVTIH